MLGTLAVWLAGAQAPLQVLGETAKIAFLLLDDGRVKELGTWQALHPDLGVQTKKVRTREGMKIWAKGNTVV